MANFTDILRPIFKGTSREMTRWAGEQEKVQRSVLGDLLKKSSTTAYGLDCGISPDMAYEEFREKVPVVAYEDIAPYVERMVKGEKSVLWPGRCDDFAQSSGTSDGRSKYIPITAESLKTNHFYGGRHVVASYLNLYPDSNIFGGKAFILGGSYANQIEGLRDSAHVGDLSATLINKINPLANLARVPGKKLALMEDWKVKLPALAKEAVKQNITNISGVPSWFLAVLKESLRITGAKSVHEIWPNLEVFFHGGIAFGPYRGEYDLITDISKMRYLESYNASEGFFAVQARKEPGAMRLLLGAGVFYEFMPLGSTDPREALPAWEVKQGHTYSLLITSCNGLMRYAIGDTVTIESTDPLEISIAGRTRHFINAFGEELMVHNAEAAVAQACAQTGASILNFSAAPVYPHEGKLGRHQWLVEWSKKPESVENFAQILDNELRKVNSDYDAKRSSGLFLDPLEIITVAPGTFDRWLESTGKLGGQRKVPRLFNSRQFVDAILKFNDLQNK